MTTELSPRRDLSGDELLEPKLSGGEAAGPILDLLIGTAMSKDLPPEIPGFLFRRGRKSSDVHTLRARGMPCTLNTAYEAETNVA